jgi:streptogramin lyase
MPEIAVTGTQERNAMATTALRTVHAKVIFKGPAIQVNGLEAVAEGLWVSDQQNDQTYLIDYSGKILTSFHSPARNASGTSFGSGSVWVASNVKPSMVFRHDPYTGQCQAAIHLPNPEKGGVHGIQWRPFELGVTPHAVPEPEPQIFPTAHGGALNAGPGVSGTLWVTRPGTNVIDHIDAETAEVLGQIPFPVSRSHGLYWENDTLVVVETNHNHVYRLDPANGNVLDEWQITGVPEAHAMSRSADGRVWIGDASTNEIAVIE